PRRYPRQWPLPPRTRARQSQSKPSSSFCVILILLDPFSCAVAAIPATKYASSREFHNRSGGGGWRRRSIPKARSSPRRFRLVHDGSVSKSVKIVKTIPGCRGNVPLSRSRLRRDQRREWKDCVTSTSRPLKNG